MKGSSYWISPAGRILNLHGGVHITCVIDHPDKFEYTLAELEAIYKHCNEPFGHEGEARRRIICSLIRQGFIRIRLYINHYWDIDVDAFDEKARKTMSVWAGEARQNRQAGRFMPVRINAAACSKVYGSYTVEDLYEGKQFTDQKLPGRGFCPVFVDSIDAFETSCTGMPD